MIKFKKTEGFTNIFNTVTQPIENCLIKQKGCLRNYGGTEVNIGYAKPFYINMRVDIPLGYKI